MNVYCMPHTNYRTIVSTSGVLQFVFYPGKKKNLEVDNILGKISFTKTSDILQGHIQRIPPLKLGD